MHNKMLSNNNNNNEVEEVVIKLDSDNLTKSLYYRDEGNMNIVVSLFAREHDEKQVMRFKKIPVDDKAKSHHHHHDHRHELMSFVRFEKLLQKYFENSDQFTVVPKIAFLDADVHALNSFLMRERPAARRNKVIGNNYGLLYRDVAFLPKNIYAGRSSNGECRDSPAICIEIKAKQGYIIADDDTIGAKKCRYCYFQYLKLKNSRIKAISSYCPIDLFSGKAERMNGAIKGLLVNPQNNLKMFLDGKMIYNEFVKDKSNLRRVLASLFPQASNTEIQEILFVNLIRAILLKDFKDDCDNDVEVCRDSCDIESVDERSCTSDSSSCLPSNCILSSILNAQMLVKENFSNMEMLDKQNDTICDTNDKLILENYKIGSTALDCSIMLTLRRINMNIDKSERVIDANHLISIAGSSTESHHFIVNATIVDLDIKKDSIAHFRKYKKQYQESKLAYYDFIAERDD